MPTRINVRYRIYRSLKLLTVAANAIVPHDLAHRCLLSMPFESDRAVDFLQQVRKILEFQSTIDILKSRCYYLWEVSFDLTDFYS